MNKKICTLVGSVVLLTQSLEFNVLAMPPKLAPGGSSNQPDKADKETTSSSNSPSNVSARPRVDAKHRSSMSQCNFPSVSASLKTSSPISLRSSSRLSASQVCLDSPTKNTEQQNTEQQNIEQQKLELLSTKKNLLVSFKKLNIKIKAALQKLQPISISLDSATDKDAVSKLEEKLNSCDKITAMFESNFKRILQSFIKVEQALHALDPDSAGGTTTTDFSALSPEYKQWQETISGLKDKCSTKLQQIIASEEAAREAKEKEKEEQKELEPTDPQNLSAQIDQIVSELSSIFDSKGDFIESSTSSSVSPSEKSEAIDTQLAQVDEQIDHIVQLKTLIQNNREKIQAQIVDIEDPQLKAAIVSVINKKKQELSEPLKQPDDDITVSEICTITELDLSVESAGPITSLNGLQFSLDLQKLNLEGQDQLSSTAVVTISLLDLRELSISGTNFTEAQVGFMVATQGSLDSLQSDSSMDFSRRDGKKVSSQRLAKTDEAGGGGWEDDFDA